jgi:hypothetical protein
VSEDTPPTNNGIPEQTPSRQDVDVLLDVPELEVDRISLTVRGLRAHVSILAELAGLVNLQVGVDARLDEVELEIEGVRAKVLLKVRLDEVRAILNHALNTLAEHPEILRPLTRALNELVSGLVGAALGTLENVLGSLEVGDTVDELLRAGSKTPGTPSRRSWTKQERKRKKELAAQEEEEEEESPRGRFLSRQASPLLLLSPLLLSPLLLRPLRKRINRGAYNAEEGCHPRRTYLPLSTERRGERGFLRTSRIRRSLGS